MASPRQGAAGAAGRGVGPGRARARRGLGAHGLDGAWTATVEAVEAVENHGKTMGKA